MFSLYNHILNFLKQIYNSTDLVQSLTWNNSPQKAFVEYDSKHIVGHIG